jgi:hypothetical protein
MPRWAGVVRRDGHGRPGLCPGERFAAAQAGSGERPHGGIGCLPLGEPMEALMACPDHVHDHEGTDREHDDDEEYLLQHATHTL